MKKIFRSLMFVLLLMFVSMFSVTSVNAASKNIEVIDITVKEKSGTITVQEPTISNGEISSGIKFNEVGDFVTFELTLKNNESDKYKIASMTDNNESENIEIDYTYGEDYIGLDETTKVTIKMTYKKKLLNQDKLSLDNLSIELGLEKEDGSSSQIIINPQTGDSILRYMALFIMSGLGLFCILTKKRIKGLKVGNLLLIISIVLIPFLTFAKENFKLSIKFTDVEVKGEYEVYNITINPNNGNATIVKTITYGDSVGELPSPLKDGYNFFRWEDKDGNVITEESIITKQIELEAKYTATQYTITYDLGTGNLPSGKTNPNKYTIESADITLNNPIKQGYTFVGWTGTSIENQTTSVTIESGSIGNRTYIAQYSADENTKYTVFHRYQNLDDLSMYTEEERTEYGKTDTEVPAPKQLRTGFKEPTTQTVLIKGDESASVTYTYNRETYEFSITDRTYIDSTSTPNNTYPYGTEIIVKAQVRAGYDFVWSDGIEDYERTFTLIGTKTLTPIYTASTNTPYKVIHKKQKISLDGYDIADTQNLTGTTDEPIEPAVNSYTGFTSPEVIHTTINGNGTTEVVYEYDREIYNYSFNSSEYVTSSKKAGDYPYGTEITVEAQERDGYSFDGWSDGKTANPYTFTLTEYVIMVPVYSANTYTISYILDDGTLPISNPNTYTIESDTFTLPEPTKNGYVFIGWTGSNGNTPQKEVTIESGSTGNKTYTANWTESYMAYNIGDEVSIGYEEFYVLENSGITERQVTLFAKNNLNIEGTAQNPTASYAATSCAFASSNYWEDTYSTHDWSNKKLDLNEVDGESSGDAIYKAKEYAKSLGGDTATGRLLTYEEAEYLYNNYRDIKTGKRIVNKDTKYLRYWLGSAFENEADKVYASNEFLSTQANYTYSDSNSYGVRPVITIDKSYLNTNKYTVTFEIENASSTPDQIIPANYKATRPATNPTQTSTLNYTFDNWYADSDHTILFDFDSEITEDTTIYGLMVDTCKDFENDTWENISTNARDDLSYYEVGCRKQLKFDYNNDGVDESYMVRVSNNTYPSECERTDFSQTACGVVIEFENIIFYDKMCTYSAAYFPEPGSNNVGGWNLTFLRNNINQNVYFRFDNELRAAIVPTIAVSGNGYRDDNIIESYDNVYLLSPVEVYGKNGINNDTSINLSRRLDYYSLHQSNSFTKKNNSSWWLRSASNFDTDSFYVAYSTGAPVEVVCYNSSIGISPAFRIADGDPYNH